LAKIDDKLKASDIITKYCDFGMESGELDEAVSNIDAMRKDYDEMNTTQTD